MDDRPTLEVIAQHLALAVQPLRDAVASLDGWKRFMVRLGWTVNDLPPAYAALVTDIDAVEAALAAWGDPPTPDDVTTLLSRVKALADAIAAVHTAPAGVDPQAFLADVGERIFQVLLVDYLTVAFPFLARLLELLHVIQYTHNASTPDRPAYSEVRFVFEQIPRVIADPESIPALVYGWGTPDLDFALLAGHIRQLFVALGLPVALARANRTAAAGYQGPRATLTKTMAVGIQVPVVEVAIADDVGLVGLQILELPGEAGVMPGLVVEPMVPSGIDVGVPLGDDLRLDFRAGSDLAQTFGILVRPGGISVRYPFAPGTAPPAAGFGADLTFAPAAPTLLLGSPDGSRLQAKGAKTGIGLDLVGTDAELHATLELVGLSLVIAAGDQDGFLATLLGGGDLTVGLPLALRLSTKTGLTFSGSASFDVTAAPHLTLGPIVVEQVHVALLGRLESGQPPKLETRLGATLTGIVGPVTVSVADMGVRLDFVAESGNAGPFDVGIGFQPPTGAGIVVDAGPITGGGFLSFDPEAHRYAGMLQLQVYTAAVTAIGLLDTGATPGAPGFSFLIIINTEFPPIPLGFGFMLEGVGGICGLHRTVMADVLRAGIKNHSVDDLLFPDDPIANSARIISDLAAVFPPMQGRFVFGPMAIITWGEPTLIEAELGIVLELPAPIRIILLGEIGVYLPTKDEDIVALHIDLLGVIDFGAKLISIDGTLYDSRVASFSIAGDMAFRFSWGSQPNKALSLGGLHPRYQPPPQFPKLDRLTIGLGDGDNPRISLQAYFAITSNTIQLGALAEVYAEAAGFNIYGWVGFDVLMTRSPLSLDADLSGGVALRHGTSEIAGIHLEASLTGPTPWHAKGEASLSLLFFDISVPFDHTFGDSGGASALPATDPGPALLAALSDPRNWSGEPAPGVGGAVSCRRADPTADVVLVDPASAAVVRQRVVPLDRQLTRFGDAIPTGPGLYHVDSVDLGGGADPSAAPVEDYFAPAQFEAMSDDDKLSRPSFELMTAGVRVGAGRVAGDAGVATALEYETIIVDSPWGSHRQGGFHVPSASVVEALAACAAPAVPAGTGLDSFQVVGAGPRLSLGDERYVIAQVDDLTRRLDLAPAGTQGAVLQALRAHLVRNPADRRRLQVVPLQEAEAAA